MGAIVAGSKIAKTAAGAIFTVFSGKREQRVELTNESSDDLLLAGQLVLSGKTTEGVGRTTVKPGEKAEWGACKADLSSAGSHTVTAFNVSGKKRVIVLSTECPWLGSAKARSEIYEAGSEVVVAGLAKFEKVHAREAHRSHQTSSDGQLHGTINCSPDKDSVVFRYVFRDPEGFSRAAAALHPFNAGSDPCRTRGMADMPRSGS